MGKKQYKGRIFTREKIIQYGDRLEISIYPVFQRPGIRRSKCRESTEIQRRLNERNSVMNAIRVANANFSERDLAMSLTYATEPESMEEANRILDNFLRKLRRRYAKLGIELKYMKRTEKGKKEGRIHHHLYLTGGMDRDDIERLWGLGRCNTRRLQFGEDGIDGLTAYMAGSGKARETYRRWSCSRNCVHPEPENIDGRMDAEEADDLGEAAEQGLGGNLLEELYPSYECIHIEGQKNEINRGYYTYAILRRRC